MRLFVFGLGYTSRAFARHVRDRFSQMSGTVRSVEKAKALAASTIHVHALDDLDRAALEADIAAADAILVSAAPNADGDPFMTGFSDMLDHARKTAWVGYLSTIGVYGNQDGAWVDEETPPQPKGNRSIQRIDAEKAWFHWGQQTGRCVQVFRLGGIYGPGRNPFVKLKQGKAQRIVKAGQVFNRIHVDDIAAVLASSLDRPHPGAIYNVCDDEPAPPQDVIAYAARLAGVEPPPEVPFETAELTPMAREFYADNKRISNRLIRSELGVNLLYPTYREGLLALHQSGAFDQAA